MSPRRKAEAIAERGAERGRV